MSKRCCAKSCYNSQLKNRMVHYFAFPKNENYARKWAVAAGREDLLEKPIQNIIKYFLCSSHFSDDCFQDPPLNSRLKKTLRPVTVPIPTIFVSNIEQFMPGEEDSLSYDRPQTEDDITFNKTTSISLLKTQHLEQPMTTNVCHSPSPDMEPIYLEEYDFPETKKSRYVESPLLSSEPDQLEERLDEDDEQNEALTCSDNYFMKNEDSETSTQDYLDDQNEINQFPCRLCANDFFEDQLLFFHEDAHLIDLINDVLPRSAIQPDDCLPQQICVPCLKRVHQCCDILNDFEAVQEKLRTS